MHLSDKFTFRSGSNKYLMIKEPSEERWRGIVFKNSEPDMINGYCGFFTVKQIEDGFGRGDWKNYSCEVKWDKRVEKMRAVS